MNLLTIPLRNTRRRPSRTLLLLAIFTLGVMSIVALYQVSQVVGHSLEKKLSTFGANILVSPGTESLSVSYGGFHLGDMLFDVQPLHEEETVKAIQSIELDDRISVIAPKLVSMTSFKQMAVAVVGVRWQEEQAIKSYWAADGAFPAKVDEILVGSQAAAKLGISVGDSIKLMNEQFNVSGILFETGGDDDTVILMDIESLQGLTNRPNEVSFIEVAALCSGCPIDDIVGQMRGQLPGAEIKALRNVVTQRMASIDFVQRLVLSISIVLLITAAAMVGLSMLSAVNERKKDIGLLRSLGYGKAQVFLIFCIEAGLIGMIAGLIGYLGGFAASFKALDILTLSDGATPVFAISHLILTCGVISLVAVLAALYPAWKGSAVEPSQALVAL
jgi:putative ABC transport system permease protein